MGKTHEKEGKNGGEIHVMRLSVESGRLEGELRWPKGARGLVIFAHGSGSSRFIARNQEVARGFGERGLATLQMDLLAEDEAQDPELIFDAELLAQRLERSADWVTKLPGGSELNLGFFGANTGTAAVLTAAAEMPERVKALVCRGGRPDLALNLGKVRAPTLLIVGGADYPVIEMNEKALAALRCVKQLEIIPGATHLFTERGAQEKAAALAQDWLARHLL